MHPAENSRRKISCSHRSPSPQPQTTGLTMNAEQNIAVVKQAYGAFGRGDIPALLALLDENVDWQPIVGTNPPVPTAGRRHGRADVGRFFEAIGKNLTFSLFEPREFVAQGDKVVALGHYTSKTIP